MSDTITADFSIPRHTDHLNGYMDAVGRALSTDDVLYALSARRLEPDETVESALGATPGGQTRIENWSLEFGHLVEDLLVLDQRERLAFYLIDLINRYATFTQNAQCHRLDCAPLNAGTLQQAIYLLQLQGDAQVLITASRTRKNGGH